MDLRDDPQASGRDAAGFAVLAASMALAAGLAAALGACAYSGPRDMYNRLTTKDYGKAYIGMSKAEVLTCAGQPWSRIATGAGSETLIYHYTGAGPVPGGAPVPDKNKKKDSNPFSGFARKKTGDFACTASLVFNGDKLAQVIYASKDVRSPYDWESQKDPKKREEMKEEGVPTCVFSLPHCQR
jgi:hypothetical protein